jgi:hypothetical protein
MVDVMCRLDSNDCCVEDSIGVFVTVHVSVTDREGETRNILMVEVIVDITCDPLLLGSNSTAFTKHVVVSDK